MAKPSQTIGGQLFDCANICGLPEFVRQRLYALFSIFAEDTLNFGMLSHCSSDLTAEFRSPPFLWYLALRSTMPEIGFFCDPAESNATIQDRNAISIHKVRLACELLSFANARSLEKVLPLTVPDTIPNHWSNASWIAVNAIPTNIALRVCFNLDYANEIDSWRSAARALLELGRYNDLKHLLKESTVVLKELKPVRIDLELLPNGEVGQIIIRFASTTSDPRFISRWIKTYKMSDEPFQKLLNCFPIASPYPKRSIHANLSMPGKGVTGSNLTLDIAISKLMNSEAHVIAGIRRVLGMMNIATDKYEDVARILCPNIGTEGKVRHSLIGTRIARDNNSLVTMMLQPSFPN